MKRPLVVLAAGFVLGEVLALQAHRAVDIGILAWLCAAVAGGLWLRHTITGSSCHGMTGKKMQGRNTSKQRVFLLFLSCFLAGCSLGAARGRQEREVLDREEAMAGELAGEAKGARILVRGRIGRVDEKEEAYTLTLEDVLAEAGNKSWKFRRVTVYAEKKKERHGEKERETGPETDRETGMEVGEVVEVRGSLEPIEGPRNPGEFDFRTYNRTKGIACRIFGQKVESVGGERIPYHYGLGRFKAWCAGILQQICVPEDVAVFKAVLLGDTSSMTPEVHDMYQRHGISHLLAVSGQHLAIIGGGIYLLLRYAGLGFGRAGMASAFLVVSYGILTGSSGSAIRAVIMILCLWLAAVKGRSYDTMSALSLAALILLFKEPYMLYHSGFQLSFGAVLAIGGLGSWIQSYLMFKRSWEKTLLISLCVQVVLTPVVLYHYYQYPLYGMFLNLLVIPLISILMYSGIMGIALGSFWVRGGMAAVGAGHYILRFYEWLCGLAEHLPGYCLIMGRPSWIQIGLYGLGMTGALAGMRVLAGKKKSAGAKDVAGAKIPEEAKAAETKSPSGPLFLTALLLVYALCFMMLFPTQVKNLEIVCLDVGQGDGLVLMTGEYVVLMDGGSSSQKKLGGNTLEPYLKSRGIRGIDYAIVSHGDGDHISGLIYLLEESRDIHINHLILPVMGTGEEIYCRLETLAKEKGADVFYMGRGDRIVAGALEFTCLYAGEDFGGQDRNSHSLVICSDYGGFHMLFTGDMGEQQENRLMELAEEQGSLQGGHLDHVQVMKLAHHGSGTSSSEAFLERLRLNLALISYGRGNSYGHPSPKVLERLENLGIPVLETGKAGAITLKTDGAYIRIHTFLKEDMKRRRVK